MFIVNFDFHQFLTKEKRVKPRIECNSFQQYQYFYKIQMNNFRVATMKAAKNQLNSPNPKVHSLYSQITHENYYNIIQKVKRDQLSRCHKLDFPSNKFIELQKASLYDKYLMPTSSYSNLLNQNSTKNCAQLNHINYVSENGEKQKLSLESTQKKKHKQNLILNKKSTEGYHPTVTSYNHIVQNQNCVIKSQGNKIILNPKINHTLFDHFRIKGLKFNSQFRQYQQNQQREENNISSASTQETRENLNNSICNLRQEQVKEISTHRETRHKKTIFNSPTFLRNKKNSPYQCAETKEHDRSHHSSKSVPKQLRREGQIQRQIEHESKRILGNKRYLSSQKNLSFGYSKNQLHFKPYLRQKKEQTMRVLQKGQQLCLKIFSHQHKIRRCNLKVIKKIAQNGHNSVYLVMQKMTGFLYCLKKCEVKPSQQKTSYADHFPNLIEYLIRQSKIGMSLDHPFLVKTYCTLYDQHNIYQLMQYVEGASLHHHNEFRKRNKPAGHQNQNFLHSIKEIKQIITQLLQGMIFMHNKKIAHRDLKPANIFISTDHTFKIGDFGCSIYQPSNDFVGTLDYVSPEILRHQAHGLLVDMWAIGCITYELYTGRPPFFDLDREKTIQNILECRYNDEIIEDYLLKKFIDKLLQVHPQKRMSAREAYDHPFISEHKTLKFKT